MDTKCETAALYVGDLHFHVTEPILFETFRPAGPIHSIWLCRDKKTDSSLGYAYVNFHRQADAERALEMLKYELLMGQPMKIMGPQRDPTLRNTGVGNLFIRNVDKSIDSMDLFDLFSIFGKVLSCKVADDKTGTEGSYAFIHFESLEAANRAIEKLNGKLLNDRQIFIEHFMPRKSETALRPQVPTKGYTKNLSDDTDINNKKVEKEAELKKKYEQARNIYVKNLDGSVDDKCLRSQFSIFGTIIHLKVVMENGRSKGFGFVCFSTPEEASNAKKGMNGKMWGKKLIKVGLARRRE